MIEYSKQNNVDLVVKYNQGRDILFASDSLDITQTVIEGLNLAYANPETDTDVALDTTTTK